MTARDVREKRSERGCWRRRRWLVSGKRRGGEPSREQADRGGFHISLDASNLAGETQTRIGFQSQPVIEQFRAIQKRVAVQPAQPRERSAFKAGDHAED